jgi:hypothetical protein
MKAKSSFPFMRASASWGEYAALPSASWSFDWAGRILQRTDRCAIARDELFMPLGRAALRASCVRLVAIFGLKSGCRCWIGKLGKVL